MAGIDSMRVGDSDLGGGGNGLSRSVETLDNVADNGSVVGVNAEPGPFVVEDRLSNETVLGTFCLTSLPWREGGTPGRRRLRLGDDKGCTRACRSSSEGDASVDVRGDSARTSACTSKKDWGETEDACVLTVLPPICNPCTGPGLVPAIPLSV